MIGQLDQGHFARWVMGQINSNIKRAWLAEYLINTALDVQSDIHEQWGDFDVLFESCRIEVKCSGFITPPFPTQHLNENPRFDVAPRVAYWSDEQGKRLPYAVPTRPADLYIFCLHAARTEEEFDPFRVEQWRLACIPTSLIDSELGAAKSISWSRAQSMGFLSSFHTLKTDIRLQKQGETI